MPKKTNDELLRSELPAHHLLIALGYTDLPPATLKNLRPSARDAVLPTLLTERLPLLNPGLTPDQVHRALRALTNPPHPTLLEANQHLHTLLTRGADLTGAADDGKTRTVRFFDFDDPTRNLFHVARQFRVKGLGHEAIPDLVVFVNGIPLAVLECKSPTLGESWLSEAVNQLLRYQEDEGYEGLGAPQLFHTAQLTLALCGERAAYGTLGTPQRFYMPWKDVHPHTLDDLRALLPASPDRPTQQDILLFGLLHPANLLALTRDFVAFEAVAEGSKSRAAAGRTIRKVARYTQFRAVRKIVDRATGKDDADTRGGVIWHTQGSGKSLTMLWTALTLRRELGNPTLLIVTDRRNLDRQITDVFHACGYPTPEQAQSVQDLRRLLGGPGGQTILTTVHKFQQAGGVDEDGRALEKHPVLSESDNVVVLTDEAHRTQYGSLAANLRRALPGAVFLGFTGTPIDKKDRSTLQTFGPYIDRYTLEQAVADEATLAIYYESRLPEVRVVGRSLDEQFDALFGEYEPAERERIKARFTNERALAEARERIAAIAEDLLRHFREMIAPNGFKAQIVAPSRHAAVTYKEVLDALGAPESKVVFSENRRTDKARLVRHRTTSSERDRLVERFKRRDDPLTFLIVCDMLLTGFDAPIEQVMYLDAPLREHTLLQAIARVNRKATGKNHGLIVDYWGVSTSLAEALKVFAPSDVEGAMHPKGDELPRLEERRGAALALFAKVDKPGRPRDLDGWIRVLEGEDVRADFSVRLRRFNESMDLFYPDPRAVDFLPDLRWLGKVARAAKARFHDPVFDFAECADKVRRLVDDAIAAEGIEILVREVSILDADFVDKLAALPGDEARASEMEHGIRHEIHVRWEENPELYRSLLERLERIVAELREKRIDAARQLELFGVLKGELEDGAAAAREFGLSAVAHAIWGILTSPEDDTPRRADEVAETVIAYSADPQAGRWAELARRIEDDTAESTGIVDWVDKAQIHKEILGRVSRRLVEDGGLERQLAARRARRVLQVLKAREARG